MGGRHRHGRGRGFAFAELLSSPRTLCVVSTGRIRRASVVHAKLLNAEGWTTVCLSLAGRTTGEWEWREFFPS